MRIFYHIYKCQSIASRIALRIQIGLATKPCHFVHKVGIMGKLLQNPIYARRTRYSPKMTICSCCHILGLKWSFASHKFCPICPGGRTVKQRNEVVKHPVIYGKMQESWLKTGVKNIIKGQYRVYCFEMRGQESGIFNGIACNLL